MLARSLVVVAALASLALALAGCGPAPCCESDEQCGAGLGCFDGKCTFACERDDDCAPTELCVPPLEGDARKVCVAPGEDVSECRPRSAPPSGDAGPRDDGGVDPLHDAGPDVAPGCFDDLHEPNETRPAATSSYETPVELTICSGDVDWFRVGARAGQELEVRVLFVEAGGGLRLELYGPQPEGNLLMVASTEGGQRVVRHRAVRNGIYAARVMGSDLNVQTRYTLVVEVREGDGGPPPDDGGPPPDDGGPPPVDGGPPPVDGGPPPGDGGPPPGDGGPPPVDGGPPPVDGGPPPVDSGPFDAGSPGCVDDGFEQNDSRLDATPLARDDALISAVLCDGDPDLFRVPVANGETLTATLRYDAPPGMRLTASRPGEGVIDSSATGSGIEVIDFTSQSEGSVYLRIAGVATGAARPYDLVIVRDTGGACVDDGFENNDGLAQAAPVTAPTIIEATHCTGDPDFYSLPTTNLASLTVDLTTAAGPNLVLTVVRRATLTILAIETPNDGPTTVDVDAQTGPLLLIVSGAVDGEYTVTLQ